jgi:arginase
LLKKKYFYEKDLRPKDQAANQLDLKFATPKELKKNFDTINTWLDEQKIDYLVVHFDLDVLSPEDFRSIYPAEPYLKSFDTAVGEMTLEEITNLLLEVSKKAEIVGLTIAEHLPWDAFRLRNSLTKLSLFKES